jgi:peroxiredoxin Q/BCP
MKAAPNFSLQDQTGTTRTLSNYAGKWLVLYFYPKDNTPGCTTEACNFRDARDSIAALGNAEVVGVSRDSVQKHANFAKKYDLNFTLLSDPDTEVIKAYNSWGERKLFGKLFLGILRNTFIIDPTGNIVNEYLGVDPQAHAAEIINDLKSLQST